MLEMYKDILKCKELGERSRSIVKIKDKCKFDTLSQTVDFTIKLYYEEIAAIYFEFRI